ncbi:SDR family oxidoreductase [Candidatus Bealeia paramacronuclearis]|uniref:SDR family oxidoreductase n=1 Tax=Candidatus Bealeia paramacronuclearis TaxID=1921001 RepID=A0ABZ2C6C8_9PROT|nr:SDR family oxidoreductase [Candidatus Bealeia paramacronuclearis]
MQFLALGYGYTSQLLGKRLLAQGLEVSGTSRSEPIVPHDKPRENLLQFRGLSDRTNIQTPLKNATHILVSIPPSLKSLAALFEGGEFPYLKWLGILSSTGVYGDHQGAWVNETSHCTPTSESGILRLADEKKWLTLFKKQNLPVHIFRLSGIYGPGRNYFSALQNGTAQRIYKKGIVFSRIHVEDIVCALEASIQNPTPGEIYNLGDDLPASPWEVMDYAAQLLGITTPPLIAYEDAVMSPMLKSFYQDSKRISNQKIKDLLNFHLTFPTYREGLKNIFEIL